jgi:hypothetical protein
VECRRIGKKNDIFLEHPDQVRTMGDASYKIAIEKFDADKVNQKLMNILGL